MLQHPEVDIRKKALTAILFGLFSQPGSASVISALIEAASDDDDQVREIAMGCLANVEDGRVGPILISGLRDASVNVRCRAAKAPKLADPRYIEALGQTVNSDEFLVASTAFATLSGLGPGHPAIETNLDRMIRALDSEDPEIAGQASRAVAHSRIPRAIAAIRSHLKANSHNLLHVMSGLLGHPETKHYYADLLDLTRLAEPRIRRLALNALIYTNDPKVSPLLVKLLRSPDSSMAQLAAFTLGAKGDLRARDQLELIAKSRQDIIGETAARLAASLPQSPTHWTARFFKRSSR